MKKVLSILILFLLWSNTSLLAIDPVEIGKPYKQGIETNLSVIDNLNQNFKEEKIKIDKDIRTKKKGNFVIKKKNIGNEEVKTDNLIDKKLARIQGVIEEIPNEIQIFFKSETANLKEDDINKIKRFINNQTEKNKVKFKVTSYAKTNKTEDISRRLSLDRAINIRTILLKEGVPARNLIVKSFGDSKNKENKVIIEFEKK